MKIKLLKHPKLYFMYEINNQKTILFYYCNQLDDIGDRLSNIKYLNIASFSDRELIEINKQEYRNLLIYINRQEKVLNNYLKKKLSEQYNIVKESLSLMYNFTLSLSFASSNILSFVSSVDTSILPLSLPFT